jgi:hypothetical protein
MTQNSDRPQKTAFARALEVIAPGASGSELVPLFNAKVDRTTILNWRAGRAAVPLWAIEQVRQIHARKAETINNALAEATQKETGPGKRAGRINIMKWNAANPR